MSEFKFACPVCGQHITADSGASGNHIECPTCFQQIVVPQAPSSGDSKLILSAAQVGKPRPMPAETAVNPLAGKAPGRLGSTAATVGLVVVVLATGAAVIAFRKEIFKPGGQDPPQRSAPAAHIARSDLKSAPPGPSNTNWTLDLANTTFPERPAAGRIHGSDFVSERATLEGNTFALRQGKGWPPPLGFTLLLPARPPGEGWSGQSISVTTNQQHSAPRVVMRWKDAQGQPTKLELRSGYALQLAFGQAETGRITGRIYLCMPDDDQSCVAGTFDAEIRKPPPRKPRPPRPPK
jgi:hypothetical protein